MLGGSESRLCHAFEYDNGSAAIVFQCIGFLIQIAILALAVFAEEMPIGHKLPVVVFAILYSIVLDLLNGMALTNTDGGRFLLVHMLLIFVFAVVSLPIIYMGNKKE